MNSDLFDEPDDCTDALGHRWQQARTYEPCPKCKWNPRMCGCNETENPFTDFPEED